MDQFGKSLVVVGMGIAILGAILWLGQSVPWLRLGRLPGDISYHKDGFSFFIPITTMVLLSAIITLAFWLVSALRR